MPNKERPDAKRIADELAQKRLIHQEAVLDEYEKALNTLSENQSRIQNILTDSLIILQRREKTQSQNLVSQAIDSNDSLDKLNKSVEHTLRDLSWRRK